MDIDKLKVAELRAELSKRNLDTKGTKPVLVARLKEAITNEGRFQTFRNYKKWVTSHECNFS